MSGVTEEKYSRIMETALGVTPILAAPGPGVAHRCAWSLAEREGALFNEMHARTSTLASS